MYLKSIEVQGFKSFANRMVFDFHDGITGIVGPNGSGKSNIADAVRWVLGEQRIKQLRGSSMQDVIFSGTENRKPLSYAKVAITLDNSDHVLPIEYEEVTVTRKLYRSGESEYLMNGTACRLRDINELFYDTGIGKEGYSIIGQGQIEKILSGKPEERRELFDEAAGIVKFKRRKYMTQKKLEEERANLVRVRDILDEISKQVGPLEKQSQVAKSYLKFRDELRSYDINMFLLETQRIEEQQAQIGEQLIRVSTEYDEATQKLNETKEQYHAIETEMDEIAKTIDEAREKRSQTERLKQQLENQIELLKEQINSSLLQDEHFQSRVRQITEEIEKRREQQRGLEEERAEIERSVKEAEEQEGSSNRELEELMEKITRLEEEIEEKQGSIIRLLNERAAKQANLERYDTMLEQNQVQKSQMSQRLIAMKSQESKHLEEEKSFNAQMDDLQTNIDEKRAIIKKAEETIRTLQDAIQKETGEFQSLQSAFHMESSRLESLKNITERYDGYGNSIRQVMEQKKTQKGLYGVVADIIQTEKKYELAIETALGGNIQNIVVENEDTAKDMIAFLKKNRYGRATFLPLTSVRQKRAFGPAAALKEDGVIGVADTLVQVEDKYRDVAAYLLGRTLVVSEIRQAIAIARKYDYQIRIVTLEGDVMNPGGSMAGGAYRNASNLLSRRREIQELEEKAESLRKRVTQTGATLDQHKNERAENYHILDSTTEEMHGLEIQKKTLQMSAEAARMQQRTAMEDYSQIQQEGRKLEDQVKEIQEMKDAIEADLKASHDLEEETMQQISSDELALLELRKQEEERKKSNEDVHLHTAQWRQKYEFSRENEERILTEIADFEHELEELHAQKQDGASVKEEKEEQIQKIESTIADSAEVFAELEETIAENEKRREELSGKHKSFIDQRERLTIHRSDLDKEAFRLNSRKESFDEAFTKQVNYMWDEYEVTFDDARSMRNEELTDLTYMKKHVAELKDEIKKLGPVNVNAIEDFRVLNERHTFLKTQHDDLITAEATLVDIISELEEGMRRQFKEKFAEINREYNEVFKQLFGGGKGSLELLDEDDILETGIQIIAQPPGKKLQNMMQLSGGEKSLTAIALLFAIQNMKPSPFCLLDEIEAALDDSNVFRFAEYLQRMTEHTQFIIITHRRGTMQAADRLYGITMQEKGVSTQVSVDLVEGALDK